MSKTNINISYTKINTLDKGCSISLSKTYQRNKNVVNKRNEGFGEEAGNSVILQEVRLFVNDDDTVDAIASKTTNQY